jgi:hypothetical protein
LFDNGLLPVLIVQVCNAGKKCAAAATVFPF